MGWNDETMAWSTKAEAEAAAAAQSEASVLLVVLGTSDDWWTEAADGDEADAIGWAVGSDDGERQLTPDGWEQVV